MKTNVAAPKNIDEYIATFPAETQALLKVLRATIKSAAPDAVEAISYQMPAFKLFGMSGLLVLPLVWSSEPREPWFYLISLGAVFGIYFISSGQRENRPFVESVLRFLRSSAFAALLSLVSWILIYSVYLSIQYIFEIWKDSNNRMEFYLLHFVYLLLFPLFFLYFHQDKRDLFTNNKVTDLLFNCKHPVKPVL